MVKEKYKIFKIDERLTLRYEKKNDASRSKEGVDWSESYQSQSVPDILKQTNSYFVKNFSMIASTAGPKNTR
jgi:hypothetical protein